MTPKKKLVAEFYNAHFNRVTKTEVSDEHDAIRIGLHQRHYFFNTYEQVSLDLDGQTLTGKPENYSGRRFLGVDRLYTRDEVIAQYENDLKNLNQTMRDEFSRSIAREALTGVIGEYKSRYGAADRFIPEPGRPGDFIGLRDNEKAFDMRGNQIWPQKP